MEPSVHASLVDDKGSRFFGPGPFRLLEGVDRLGSLSAVSREMGMSYSKANRVVKAAEAALGFPLLARRIGGADGGSSELTAQGANLLERYRAFEGACERAAASAFASCFEGVAGVAPCACVVLANGRSERFGSQKLLADLDGEPVLARTLGAVPTELLDVVVACSPGPVQDLARGLGYECVEPVGPDVSDSVRAGLAAFPDAAGCLFVCADQPRLTPDDVARLVDAHQTHPGAVVRLGFDGVGANPVLWPRDLFSSLRVLEGDRGGASLLERRPDVARRVVVVEASGPDAVADVDTPDQLQRLSSRP